MSTYQLPQEELGKAAEDYVETHTLFQDPRHAFVDGSTHTMQTLTPTLDKALEALESVQWIDVNERLPDVNQAVLTLHSNPIKHFKTLILGHDGVFFKDFNDDDYSEELFSEGFYANVTHWMPLPDTTKITEAINELKKLKG